MRKAHVALVVLLVLLAAAAGAWAAPHVRRKLDERRYNRTVLIKPGI